MAFGPYHIFRSVGVGRVKSYWFWLSQVLLGLSHVDLNILSALLTNWIKLVKPSPLLCSFHGGTRAPPALLPPSICQHFASWPSKMKSPLLNNIKEHSSANEWFLFWSYIRSLHVEKSLCLSVQFCTLDSLEIPIRPKKPLYLFEFSGFSWNHH